MIRRRSTGAMMHRAIELRKEPTDAENKLWSRLRNHQVAGVAFRRQHAIGPYILDFYAPRIKLAVEVDGSQHLDQADADAERTDWLAGRGIRVIRFWNHAVLNDIEGVMRSVLSVVEEMDTGGS